MCLYVHRKDSVERISRKNEAGERNMSCLRVGARSWKSSVHVVELAFHRSKNSSSKG